jgi:hypothetical protein
MLVLEIVAGWLAAGLVLSPAVGAVLRHNSRFYPPVR